MTLTNKYQRIPLDKIRVKRDERQRREIDVRELAPSIAKRGVMNPILVEVDSIVTGTFILIAGERRYAASLSLDLPDIPCRIVKDLTPVELQIIELEENLKRQDITWQETCNAVMRVHELFVGARAGWTQIDTCAEIDMSQANFAKYFAVYPLMDDPAVAKATTQTEAYNYVLRKRARAAGDAMQEFLEENAEELGSEAANAMVLDVQALTSEESQAFHANQIAGQTDAAAVLGQWQSADPAIFAAIPGAMAPASPADAVLQKQIPPRPAPPQPPSGIICADALQWMREYRGEKFNLIHCDFPYGINVFAGPQGRQGGDNRRSDGGEIGYNDSPDVYFQLLAGLLDSINNVALYSCHLVFWYSARHLDATRNAFAERAPEFKFNLHPLIWHKTDNLGISPDAARLPRHVYETALVATRGDRKIVRIAPDCYGAPTDKRLHPSAKPEPVLRQFFAMYVDETTTLFDPTAGGGSALRAAESLGAKRVLGLELDPGHAATASEELSRFRMKRRAEQSINQIQKERGRGQGQDSTERSGTGDSENPSGGGGSDLQRGDGWDASDGTEYSEATLGDRGGEGEGDSSEETTGASSSDARAEDLGI